jgi:hypothetical protein
MALLLLRDVIPGEKTRVGNYNKIHKIRQSKTRRGPSSLTGPRQETGEQPQLVAKNHPRGGDPVFIKVSWLGSGRLNNLSELGRDDQEEALQFRFTDLAPPVETEVELIIQ